MNRKVILGLFLAGLVIALAAASLEHTPGYMDAEYYYAGALRLVSGQGWSEPYLWNYLNNPSSLPAPAFSYWMPLPSLVAAAGLAIAHPLGWWGARLGFILLAACLPPLTALLSYRLTKKPSSARLAGLLALFPGFYLPVLTTTDAFPIDMVLGALFFLLSGAQSDWAEKRTIQPRLFGLGLLAGLLHLTRADGLLWIAGAGFVALEVFQGPLRAQKAIQTRPAHVKALLALIAASGGLILAGYALVMLPWFVRNIKEWGSLFPPGGSRALWITDYSQTMIYPSTLLTAKHWLAAGFLTHLQAWGSALSETLQTILSVQSSIVLFPFILVAVWQLRGCTEVRLGMLMWAMIAGVMTIIFPLAGVNGGYFHSGAALQPLWWALAPAGLDWGMLWYARQRKISAPAKMVRFMGVTALLVAVLLSGLVYFQHVVGTQPGELQWSAGDQYYRQVEQALVKQGAQPGEAVLVNNAPGYWLASGRPAVVIPDGDTQMLLSVARQFGIRYLVLEVTNPYQLADLYLDRIHPPELTPLTSVGTTRLFRIDLPAQGGSTNAK